MIRKLDFTPLEKDLKEIINQCLCFVKPINGKLYRCFKIHDDFKTKELIQVMNTLCRTKHKGVYYFLIEGDADNDDFMDIFINMDLYPVIIDLNKTPENLN